MSPPVLVTGATGLVGNNTVRRLLEAGRSVRALVRETSDRRPLEGLDVDIVRGDIREEDSVQRACQGTDCVIHAAAYVQLGRSRLDLHRAINVGGTRNVATAARALGIRMIHVSSVDTLGVRSVREPADEETLPSRRAACNYVITKREAERVVMEEVARGLDAVVVHPGFMLGPWDWKPSSGRMLLEVARRHAFVAPRGWFSLCDVRDVVEGILAALTRGRTGRRYILAGTNMTYLQAWRLFAEVAGATKPWVRVGPVILWFAGRSGDLRAKLTGVEPNVNSGAIAQARLPKCYTNHRAEVELGYRSRPPRDTVKDAWEWFRHHGFVPNES